MEAQPLYDLSPIVHIMLVGVLVACVPLTLLWMRNRETSASGRLRALTVLTLFLTFDLVLFGAFTRLTDSGLGCPDWPGCYGSASPVGAHADIKAAQTAMPTGPVTHSKAWVEMVHRYLATGVGVLILVLAVTSWVLWPLRGGGGSTVHPWWATVTLVWVCVQGAFGALTVTMKLFPAIVTMHLIGGLVLLALLCMQAVRYRQSASGQLPVAVPTQTRALMITTFVALAIQIALGGWVSTNYAVLACRDFPQCQGSWLPAMDFHQGFEIWRALGLTGAGESITFAALTAIHYTHRMWAVAVFALLIWLAVKLWNVDGLQRQAKWLAGLALWQFVTGLSNVVLDWPLVAAVSHTGGAAALVTVLTWTTFESRSAARAQTASRIHSTKAAA